MNGLTSTVAPGAASLGERRREERGVTVETQHPYNQKSLNKRVALEESECLLLHFDARCCSSSRDRLTVSTQEGTFLADWSGASWPLPNKPVLIPGNSVTFTWSNDK